MSDTAELRVLQVLGSSAGGVARHVAQLVQAGPDRGWRVVVAGPSGLAEQVVPAGSRAVFATVEISDRPGPADLGSVRRLRQLAARADVVHAHGLRAGALAVLASRRGRGDRPRVVVTLHNLPVGSRLVRGTARVLEALVARGSDVVLGVSGDLVRLAARRGARSAERALVPAPPLRSAAPAAATRTSLGVPEDAPLLVTVARLAPQKGLDLLCDAAGLLPGVHWVVAGDGPLLEELEARVRAERLPIRLLGRRGDVADLLAAADVVVSTARWEGQPLNVQEALVLGAPVVATDVGGTREVTGDAAVLVPPDAAAVAAAIGDLLADDLARAALARRALAQAATLPDLAAVLDQLDRVFRGDGRHPGETPRAAPAVG